MPGSEQRVSIQAFGMTVLHFCGRDFASFKTSLSCLSILCIPDACILFSEFRRTNMLVMIWLVCWFDVVLVIALHCPNIRSSISVFRRRSDIIQFSKGA